MPVPIPPSPLFILSHFVFFCFLKYNNNFPFLFLLLFSPILRSISQPLLFKSSSHSPPPPPLSLLHRRSLASSMATEEVSKPPSLPPYPEMIMAAIAALNEKSGSNKSAISKYIESKYGGELPESHASLLTAHLARMKESGDLIFLKNNYLRPGAEAPPKRGRGRPPKPKLPGSAPAPASAAAPPRPRGRPPKPRDPLAAAAARAAAGMPRPRGRPPKKTRTADSSAAPAPATVPGGKRGRGRPPKVKPAIATDEP